MVAFSRREVHQLRRQIESLCGTGCCLVCMPGASLMLFGVYDFGVEPDPQLCRLEILRICKKAAHASWLQPASSLEVPSNALRVQGPS